MKNNVLIRSVVILFSCLLITACQTTSLSSYDAIKEGVRLNKTYATPKKVKLIGKQIEIRHPIHKSSWFAGEKKNDGEYGWTAQGRADASVLESACVGNCSVPMGCD
jgi:hypothetical protein